MLHVAHDTTVGTANDFILSLQYTSKYTGFNFAKEAAIV